MSSESDTSIGGDQRDFPSTLWSQFLTGAPAERSLSHLVQAYWKPVYSYIRVKWAKSNEEAKDETQNFFVWIMEGDLLSRTDRTRGRFRALLKVALEHYLVDRERMRRTIKRGGDRPMIELDRHIGDLAALEIPDPAGRTPEQMMDESWKQEVLQNAMERLEMALREEGRERLFAIFQDHCRPDAADSGYRELAQRHVMTVEEVGNAIRLVKKRCRAILTDIVAETVESREDLEAEMQWLFGDFGK